MNDNIKKNIMDSNIWLRLIFMLLFAVILATARIVLLIVIIVQFLWVLFSGSRNNKLLAFSNQLATFIYQTYRYLSFNCDKRPFPFTDFPSAEIVLDDTVEKAAEETMPTEATIKEVTAEEKQRPAESNEKDMQKESETHSVDVGLETRVETENKDK